MPDAEPAGHHDAVGALERVMSSSRCSLLTHTRSRSAPQWTAACRRDSITLMYESGISTYLPTSAMRTLGFGAAMRAQRSFHS